MWLFSKGDEWGLACRVGEVLEDVQLCGHIFLIVLRHHHLLVHDFHRRRRPLRLPAKGRVMVELLPLLG